MGKQKPLDSQVFQNQQDDQAFQLRLQSCQDCLTIKPKKPPQQNTNKTPHTLNALQPSQ